MNINEKKRALEDYLRSLGSVAVAFSFGVDSTFLLKTAQNVLGEKAVAVTVNSDLFPGKEFEGSVGFCEKEGIEQIVIEADELEIEGFSANPSDRCYICKKSIFTQIKNAAAQRGIENVAEGSNADDVSDYRPGMRAVKELGVLSPLLEAGLTKAEIRALSEEMKLPTSGKPSFACLATRIARGEEITKEKLAMIEKAEDFLHSKGFWQVRVRVHGNLARIETEKDDIQKLAGIADEAGGFLESLGFNFVSLDLGGYKTGSMNKI
ncbi:MAG: ATP-dependent sacrificial sulfur transferase LarE [Clostridia bacterium]|nr:ATP-dependent sacrificial sulfur transferase LarE [Clostridia bacterium]